MTTYAELHCKTNFSFLKGASHARELVQTAAQIQLSAIAITDESGVYAIPKAFYEARQHPGLKLITGADVLVHGRSYVTLLARSRAGYGRLCRLLTEAHQNGPDTKPLLNFARLAEHLAASGGSDLLLIAHDPLTENLEDSEYTQLKDLLQDRFYLFLTRYLDGQDKRRNRLCHELSQKFDIPLVASNDAYYHTPDRKNLQDVLTSTRVLTPLEQAGLQLQQNGERYLKSTQEMMKLYKDDLSLLWRTNEIADRCSFQVSELRYSYPSEWIPLGETADSYLRTLTFKGAHQRYNGIVPGDVIQQIEHELAMIAQLKFADYFLTIWEIVDFARSRKILCQGRGSAANSVICFCLGITAVDPVRMNLLFERFLSAERGEPPDIDVDFEHERREEVIQHIYEKYGRDHAGMVSSIITYRTRSALRDVGRALKITIDPKAYRTQIQKVPGNFVLNNSDDLRHSSGKSPAAGGQTDLIQTPTPPNSQDGRFANRVPGTFGGTFGVANRVPGTFVNLVEQIKGFPRHLSIHTGGFTISRDPLIETVPIQPARMVGRTIVQWDKEDLEIVGLVKVDILALGMLTAISKTLRLIDLEFYQIPAEDKPTYDMIGRCETVGVFQIESRAQMSMLGRLQPKTFYDLVIEVAIVRPGPIMGKMVHPYLRRRRGEEPVNYPHPKLIPILGRTLGIPIFQEQVMKMAIELAGFRPGEADELRRAINAWRSVGDINDIGRRLMAGLLKSGLPKEFVERIFEQIKGFAHYGFPESHAASFALITYASCYLKHHHPLEFIISLINSQPMGFYAVHTLIEEAKRSHVHILPVDVTKSEWDCTIETHTDPTTGKTQRSLRLGLRLTSGISRSESDSIKDARVPTAQVNQTTVNPQQTQSLRDFLSKLKIRSHILHRLAMADAFQGFGLSRRDTLWQILSDQLLLHTGKAEQMTLFSYSNPTNAIFSETQKLPPPASHNFVLFETQRPPSPAEPNFQMTNTTGQPSPRSESKFAAMTKADLIENDFEVFKVSTSGHPLAALRDRGFELPPITTKEARKKERGSIFEIGGLVIVRQRPSTANGTVFATLEDEFGYLDTILRKEVYDKFHEVFDSHSFLIMKGQLQKDGNSVSFVLRSMRPIWQEHSLAPKAHDYH